MIKQVRGVIWDVGPQGVVVGVGGVTLGTAGEARGAGGSIGYFVAMPNTNGLALGNEVTLHTHLAVRENAMDLYGFLTRDELEMFELLLTIPKIGPKSALAILTQADIALLKTAALSDDAAYLSKMSGIGKKTAEKIVIELKSKLDGDLPLHSGTNAGDGDVVDALITLGYSQKHARDVVQKLSPELTGTNERIKEALRLISK